MSYMQAAGQLPAGFAVGTASGEFVSAEAPAMGKLPIKATVIHLTEGPTDSWAAVFTSNKVSVEIGNIIVILVSSAPKVWLMHTSCDFVGPILSFQDAPSKLASLVSLLALHSKHLSSTTKSPTFVPGGMELLLPNQSVLPSPRS